MKKNPDCTQDQLAAIKSAFNDFMREALERKNAVKNGDSTVAEFQSFSLSFCGLFVA